MQRIQRPLSTLLALGLVLLAVPALAADASRQVNVNSASVEQLALLPRVGPAVAQRIVEFREENGSFKTIQDLMLVRGIGEKTFELLKPHVATSGPTTLAEKVRAPRPPKANPSR